MNEQSEIEILIIERRCPNCSEDDIHYITYETDNLIYFQCLNCGWEKEYKLSDFLANGFYPEGYTGHYG